MSEQNKQLVRECFEQLWNQGDLSKIDEHFVSDYVGHSAMPIHGPEGAKQFITAMRTAFPDFHYTIEDEIAEADKVTHRWTARGTHEGLFQGIPATGKEVEITGISIYRVAEGKLHEGWTSADLLGLMQQIGAVPAPGAKAAEPG